jgi:CDP-paratose 2-epimerase
VNWIIDCAANPSVLAGADGKTTSRQLIEHNLIGTINLLEYCKRTEAGFILLSTSRVYAIEPLANLAVEVHQAAYRPAPVGIHPSGLSGDGIREEFSTAAPVSLYGATKLASETLALEYGASFGFPVWVNRCGVLAGAGQFGRPDQGIFAYWINTHLRKMPLRYIGFDGLGHQVRDCLHPRDLLPLLSRQMQETPRSQRPRLVNVSGGTASARSLRQLNEWCNARFGEHAVHPKATPRPYDLPWVVLDARKAQEIWGWVASTPAETIFEEIARHAEENPDWLAISSVN